jgi:hypothetical protein
MPQTSVSLALPCGEGGLGKETEYSSGMKMAEWSFAAVHFTTRPRYGHSFVFGKAMIDASHEG